MNHSRSKYLESITGFRFRQRRGRRHCLWRGTTIPEYHGPSYKSIPSLKTYQWNIGERKLLEGSLRRH